jgi:hypothetical protein
VLVASVAMPQLLREPPKVVVLLGDKVRRAFRFEDVNPYVVCGLSDEDVRLVGCWMPHPSGCNRHWNDPANVEQAREFLRRVMATERRAEPRQPRFSALGGEA